MVISKCRIMDASSFFFLPSLIYSFIHFFRSFSFFFPYFSIMSLKHFIGRKGKLCFLCVFIFVFKPRDFHRLDSLSDIQSGTETWSPASPPE